MIYVLLTSYAVVMWILGFKIYDDQRETSYTYEINGKRFTDHYVIKTDPKEHLMFAFLSPLLLIIFGIIYPFILLYKHFY